ncbi:MAG: PAS domain S-box protein [Lentisphaerae bacterium]|nr:PAS domain S-box protein [Lentisphaerota bacterium]
MKSAFLDKLIERLDRIDPESLQIYFLRLAKEKGLLETIFQSIKEGVIVISGTGKIDYVNRAAEDLMGFSWKAVQGRSISRYFKEIDWDRILSLDASEWSKLITSEMEITYPAHRFINFYIMPLSHAPGEENGAVVILRDVTRDRENETSLLESERLNAVKLLAAGVAHEIGNPLNALNIHLQLLEREIRNLPIGQSESMNELVQIARNEVSRLDVIITQFLSAIRPSKPNLVPDYIGELLKDTLTLLKQEIENRKIDVEIRFMDSMPKVPIDRDQMKQAFFNIIKNAFQAMPDGGSLVISLSRSDQYAIIRFQDTGTGIKPEDFGRIFDAQHTTKSDGSGLGLMIVQRIVQDHGGQIEVVSKPETGTSFTILLPCAERRARLLRAARKKAVNRVEGDHHEE